VAQFGQYRLPAPDSPSRLVSVTTAQHTIDQIVSLAAAGYSRACIAEQVGSGMTGRPSAG
jgi:hypothetical protein